ncbi:TauD/TfdA family dioxygenase [soil metagenome]
MRITPLSAPVGALIEGVDLREPLSADDFAQIREAFVDRGVVVVRNQQLDEAQFVGIARRFGEIESYESTLGQYLNAKQPAIIMLSNIVENGRKLGVQDGGQYWHTDRSYVERPAWSSMLHSKMIPHDEHGTPLGDTMFASMSAAYDALPTDEQRALEQLTAQHEYVYRFSKPNDAMPPVEHPVVLRHPLTGRPGIYVNAGFTAKLLGMSEAESQQKLASLYAHATEDRFVYRHRWQVGDVLMWDNYSTQHRAVGDYGPDQHRLMWRTTIQGFELQ